LRLVVLFLAGLVVNNSGNVSIQDEQVYDPPANPFGPRTRIVVLRDGELAFELFLSGQLA